MIIIIPMKDRKSSPKDESKVIVWEVAELKFELRFCLCLNHRVILGRGRKRG